MAIEINIKGEVLTAYLKGELDHHTAAEIPLGKPRAFGPSPKVRLRSE